MTKKYRIVTDKFAGYECQIWRLWWPFWVQMNWTNTNSLIEKAKEYIRNKKNGAVVWNDY